MKNVKIDWNKPLQTRAGEEVTILSTKGRGKFPVLYYVGNSEGIQTCGLDGYYYSDGEFKHDIINKPEKFTYWINIYPHSAGQGQDSLVKANSTAFSNRIACIKVEGYEGQFDK